jgi:hypothetical protein
MKTPQPSRFATWLLERFAPSLHDHALAGDLVEQYRQGRSAAWYWRQVLLTIVLGLVKDRTLAGAATLGSVLVLLLMLVSVGRHPSSLGTWLFTVDITLLSGYGAFSAWGFRQRRPNVRHALAAGAQTGIILGLALIASHAIEWFAPFGSSRAVQLVRGAGSTMLMLGLLSAAGSAAWQRTRSIMLAELAGLWCGSLGVLILLTFAFTLNLAFEAHSQVWLHEAFLASGMTDPGAFVVRNSLESASEILVRLPIAALLLALGGGLANAWITAWPRFIAIMAACITPFVFAAGAASLWYADSLDRAARPPFIMAGLLSASFALCGAHPIWLFLLRKRRELPP